MIDMIKLVVHGAAGRMGRRLCALASDDDRFALVGQLDMSSAPATSIDESSVDVIIDFSSDEGARAAAGLARAGNAALLVGTTGLSAGTLDVMGDLARSSPVLIAPNTSLGVAVLNHLLGEAARLLDERYQVDLIDQHHRHKLDAPSGTALRLLRTLAAARGAELPADRVHCVRAGEIVGDHEIQFAGPGERIRLVHSATSRDVFVIGALDAAAWLVGRSPGSYTIEEVLLTGVTAGARSR